MRIFWNGWDGWKKGKEGIKGFRDLGIWGLRMTETDIRTGRPIAEIRAEQEALADRKESEDLQKKMAFLDVTKSSAFSTLVEMVTQQLYRRVEVCLKDDPEARTLVELLQKMGVKTAMARKATDLFVKKYMKNKDG